MVQKRLKVINNRIINKYFYISTLSGWHFCCEKEFKKLWLKDDSRLSEEEKNALNVFSKISKKYSFIIKNKKSIYLGIPFITSSTRKTWPNIKKWVNKKEFKQLLWVFNVFEPRFKTVWQKNKDRMSEIKKLLDKNSCGKKFDQIINDLDILFGEINGGSVLNVYLQMAPQKAEIVGGGANFDIPNKISLEVNDVNAIKEYLQVIYHELTHFYVRNIKEIIERVVLKNKNIINKIKNLRVIKQRKIHGLLEELIVLSIFPDGILGMKHFPKDIRKISKNIFKRQKNPKTVFDELDILSKYIILNCGPILFNYLKNKKKIDDFFVEKILICINQYNNNKK